MYDDRYCVELYRLEASKYLPGVDTSNMSLRKAKEMIALHNPNAAWRKGPPSDKQKAFLQRYDAWEEGITKGEAADRITHLLDLEKQRPGYLDGVVRRLEWEQHLAMAKEAKEAEERKKEQERQGRAAATQPNSIPRIP